ncbi:hypothetical protein [Acidisphaera sp. S103]|uniref:hypothetical protein n=1 Tax=Acidisphaera sp. S103 TaxID=1747223 RepID=UPI00131C9FDF|nr:hypothetical protein [Acidisphaera sp. S103]
MASAGHQDGCLGELYRGSFEQRHRWDEGFSADVLDGQTPSLKRAVRNRHSENPPYFLGPAPSGDARWKGLNLLTNVVSENDARNSNPQHGGGRGGGDFGVSL